MVEVALCQRSSAGTKEHNLREITKMIEEATAYNPKLDVIIFPEYNYYAPTNLKESKEVAESIPGPFTDAISALAKKHSVNIVSGTFIEDASNGKVSNACVYVNRKGEIIGKYRKVHLMDALGYKESDHFHAGNELCLVDTDFGKVGMMVCYDLRFPELARSLVKEGANIIFCPAEFPAGNPLPPRTDHWDILCRSTALLNLTYLVACNQFGAIHSDNPFGRSMIVDPWGQVVAHASNRTVITYGQIDLEYQESVRNGVATWKNRRPEVYKL